MDGHGYTYTTLTGGRGEPMTVHTSFHLDATAWLQLCASGEGKRPFLSIDHGTVGVTIGPPPDVILTESDVAVIRRFAENAAGLLAAVEQYYADQRDTAKASGSGSAA